MFCTSCGNQLKKNAKFCSACGAAVSGKAQPQKNHKKKSQHSANTKAVKVPMPLLVAGGILILFLGFLIFNKSGNKVAQQQVAPANGISQSMQSKVFAVAEGLNCPCGQCNDSLTVCDCTNAGGAMEAKEFILKGLEKGKTVDQMKQAVAVRYPAAT